MTPPDPQESDPAPRVSVVIPTHDRPDMIIGAIETALGQSISDLEVVVIDDGSEPPVALPPGLGGTRVRLVRHAVARGVCEARNRGIAEARGTWVALLDDDDRWAPDKLERQLDAMSHGARWSFTGRNRVRPDGTVERPFRIADIARAVETIEEDNRIGTPSSVVVERALLRETGGFSTDLSVLADWDMWIRLARAAPAAPVAAPLVDYLVHDGSMHLTRLSEALTERRVMAHRLGLGRRLGGLSFWMWVARAHRNSGRPLKAVTIAAYALGRFPRQSLRRLTGAER